jgi:hypothetical protein
MKPLVELDSLGTAVTEAINKVPLSTKSIRNLLDNIDLAVGRYKNNSNKIVNATTYDDLISIVAIHESNIRNIDNINTDINIIKDIEQKIKIALINAAGALEPKSGGKRRTHRKRTHRKRTHRKRKHTRRH